MNRQGAKVAKVAKIDSSNRSLVHRTRPNGSTIMSRSDLGALGVMAAISEYSCERATTQSSDLVVPSAA